MEFNKTKMINWNRYKDEVLEYFNEQYTIISDENLFAKVSFEIKDIGEKAYQRAIFQGNKTIYNEETIEWIDLEFPVEPPSKGKARRKCIDLIGRSENYYVFAELKKEKGDSPLYAISELIDYIYILDRSINISKNDNNECLHFHESANLPKKNTIKFFKDFSLEKSILIIAGNIDYWNDYSKDSNSRKCLIECKDFLNVEKNLNIHYASYPNEDFKKQKERSSNDKYKPILENGSNNNWKNISLK